MSEGGPVLTKEDRLEAMRRFKLPKTKAHERMRYHALLLVTEGYTYEKTAEVLFVDPESVARWVGAYQREGLNGLKNNPLWGGENGQRWLTAEHLTRLGTMLEQEAMPGSEVGSGWTLRAVIHLVQERFSVTYSQSGMRKILHQIRFSCQRGRALYRRRTQEDQARFEFETHEVLIRGWHIHGLAVRPQHEMVGHTGFVSVARLISEPWEPGKPARPA